MNKIKCINYEGCPDKEDCNNGYIKVKASKRARQRRASICANYIPDDTYQKVIQQNIEKRGLEART